MRIRLFFNILCFLISVSYTAAQQINISGIITDATTGEPLPYVNVVLLPTHLATGTMTNEDGKYTLTFAVSGESIMFSYVGYEPVTISLTEVKNGVHNVMLKPLSTQLNEVVVSGNRTRYTNRDNPAVELIRNVIANKNKNRIEAQNTYEYECYEKIELSINDLSDSIIKNPIFNRFPFLFNYIDTAQHTGKLSLPIFLRENISKHYFQKYPAKEKEIKIASQMANFHDIIEQETLGVFLDGMVGKSNIYDNQIMILENEYMSPLNPLAPNFYRFHILDTVDISSVSCIWLSVYPRNAQDFGFRGGLYITNDSNYALKRAELSFTQNNNVNFVNDFSLIQEYTQIDNIWHLTLDEAVIDFSLTEKRSMIVGKVSKIYRKYQFNHPIPDSVFESNNQTDKTLRNNTHSTQFWEENRPIPLSRSEQGIYDMVDEMKKDKGFNRVLAFGGLLYSGYIDAGKFDFGPVLSIFSFNDIEGGRIRLGGKTNARLNQHLFFEGYGAYGFKDKKFKYQLGAMYSFYPRKLHPWEFPMNLLSVYYEDNIETPGQLLSQENADRLFASFYRGQMQQMVYYRSFVVNYEREYFNGFSFKPSFTRREEHPTGTLSFVNAAGNVHRITTAEFGLRLRFAPNERFYQIHRHRYSINHTNPVFSIDYNYGMKDFLGSDYEYHRLEASMEKRTWFSSFGFADMWLKAGKIWGTVPFPLLTIHPANQNYGYSDEAYNMMNYMEFVSERYAQLHVSYCFNGWIFNRLPLVKKLKWREFVTFKALWGDINENNRPENNPSLFQFPVNDAGIPVMYRLDHQPYMEAGFAVDNVFKFLRIDIVKRINYLHHPNMSEWGVRFKFRFLF